MTLIHLLIAFRQFLVLKHPLLTVLEALESLPGIPVAHSLGFCPRIEDTSLMPSSNSIPAEVLARRLRRLYPLPGLFLHFRMLHVVRTCDPCNECDLAWTASDSENSSSLFSLTDIHRERSGRCSGPRTVALGKPLGLSSKCFILSLGVSNPSISSN